MSMRKLYVRVSDVISLEIDPSIKMIFKPDGFPDVDFFHLNSPIYILPV